LTSFSFVLNRETPPEGACVNVPITAESLAESDETFTITLQPTTGVDISPTLGTATITIVNDDGGS